MNWTDRFAAIGCLAAWGAFCYCALWALKNITITVGEPDPINPDRDTENLTNANP